MFARLRATAASISQPSSALGQRSKMASASGGRPRRLILFPDGLHPAVESVHRRIVARDRLAHGLDRLAQALQLGLRILHDLTAAAFPATDHFVLDFLGARCK